MNYLKKKIHEGTFWNIRTSAVVEFSMLEVKKYAKKSL